MSGFGSSEARIPIFSGENYEFWRIKMVTIFKSYGLWTLVEKGITIPDSKKKKSSKELSAEEDDEKMATILMKGVNGEWYIDSGCSNHMTGDRKLLADIRTNVIGKVQMPNGELVNVARIGNVVIDTSKGRKYIKEVMYLPGLKENLLSVGQMDEHGYYLLFGGKMCCIFDSASLENLVIKVEMKRNRSYPSALLPNDHVALKTSVSHST
ncbi:hypothetical protein L3X38_011547 [Prunus dulcis]|uniref:Retrovirus-related Pol polyprotein from transposon TNT 1-94-like beta-barrel domain-containing protein n=1 Tax=Prunus dulcis TaxID=3755 RepID=A0AAD4ZFI6_PRUDU|nr:hypothetical protein L3X38_011547 [Prunus dulcis]